MLALIAGQGGLPTALVRALPSQPVVCALDGFPPDQLEVAESFRLETLGSLLNRLRSRGVTEICLAGAIRRPVIDPSAIDAATLPLVPIFQRALTDGDDGALRAVIGILEQSGFAVRAAQEIAPALMPSPGIPTRCRPDSTAQADARRAETIISAMSQIDVGQACAVYAGQALAIEGVFGTDWMLASLVQRPDAKPGGIFFKAVKPDQDRRVDMPTIGPDTVAAVAAAGLTGIVIQAGHVLALDLDEITGACDQLGVFLWVREAGA